MQDLPDGALIADFTIPGRPATKKTHQRIVRRGRFTKLLPSIQYEAYELHCQPYCEAVAAALGAPLDFGVAVKMTVTLPNWVVGDHTGYLQSLGDILQKWGIIADDKWINWIGDPCIPWLAQPDKLQPQVKITILRSRHPKELRK